MIKECYKEYYSCPEVREHHQKKMREWNLKRKAEKKAKSS